MQNWVVLAIVFLPLNNATIQVPKEHLTDNIYWKSVGEIREALQLCIYIFLLNKRIEGLNLDKMPCF